MEAYKIWLTTMCTLSCKYCYEKNDFVNKSNMQKDIAYKVIKYLKKQKSQVNSIIFHGGEPLLNYKVLSYLTDEISILNPEVRFGFTTNGTIWNEEIKTMLVKHKERFQNGITMSIDGTKEVHNLNRIDRCGQGTYDNVVKTLNEVKKIFPHIRGRLTITPDTAKDIYNSVVHLHMLGFTTITHAFDYFNQEWKDSDLEIIKSEYEKVIKYWEQNKELNISFADGLDLRKRKMGRCKIGINIYVDGQIYPCTYVAGDDEYLIGNIDGRVFHDRIECFKSDILNRDNKFCNTCVIKENCINNRCKFLNKKVTDDYFQPAPIACAIENVENELLIKYEGCFKDYFF